jgi:hypothetical protein
MLEIYGRTIALKRLLLQTRPGVITSSSSPSLDIDQSSDPLQNFKPKSSAEYQAVVQSKQLTKSRSHEKLVGRYGLWIATQGFHPSTTEHPRDLVLRRPGQEWLTEAKVVYQGNATNAVRAAIGQLFTYRHMLPGSPTGMLALFSEEIGDEYAALLDKLGIASVWWDNGIWAGSATALRAGLSER